MITIIISQVPNSAADTHQQGPDNISSHTTRLTTMMYFNTVTSASSHSTLSDDGHHTETCCSYCNFNVNFNTPFKKFSGAPVGNKKLS